LRGTLCVAVIALTVTGCATIRAGETRSTEQMLAAAGFHMKVADTPETAADLRALPPRKMIVQRRGAEPYYVYADPDVCNCVYTGTEPQYQEYQRLRLQKELADERLDASRSWGPWGSGLWW